MATVLVIGGGGREHAIAWKLALSTSVAAVLVAKGSGGTASSSGAPSSKIRNLPQLGAAAADVIAACAAHAVSLVVIGPEDPLANGLADALRAAGIAVFGPDRAAAQIEASKAFSKAFMHRHGIPTAAFATFTDHAAALAYVRTLTHSPPSIVIKASGLAAGKGVILPQSLAEAEDALAGIMCARDFGAAGDEIVIEQLLVGEEVSCLAFTDGERVALLPPAQDHKRVGDGDTGPNTGGMGAYAPAPIATPAVLEFVRTRVLQAAVDGMRAEGRPFVGLLYAGIMVCPNTDGGGSASGAAAHADANGLTGIHIQTLEFNCRFGDPETQVVLPLLASDLYQVCLACATGCLDRVMPLVFHEGAAAVTVVAASGGYPGAYAVGKRITGVAAAEAVDAARGRVTVFHAGTALKSEAEGSVDAASEEAEMLVTAGGRVLAVTAVGASFVEARALAYAGVAQIAFEGMHYRTDIGHRALRRIEEAAAATATAAAAVAADGKRAPLRVAVLGSTRGTALQPLIDLLERQSQRLGSESHSAAVSASPADEPFLEATICLVFSNKADAPILERARRHALPTALIEAKGRAREAVDEELSALLLAHRIDLVLLIGYMRILSAPFARAWAGRVLNVHPSLLPAFAGGMDLQVHEAVLKAGVAESGCTIHVVDEGVDSGPIVVQKRCPVLPEDTAESLKARVQALEGAAFIEAVRLFAEQTLPMSQQQQQH